MSESTLVAAFVPQDPAQQALVESILQDAGIDYVVRNAGVQNLVGIGSLGGFNFATGPIEILVRRKDLEKSHGLIAAALDASQPHVEFDERDSKSEEAPEIRANERAVRYSRFSVIWAALWCGGAGSLLAIHLGLRALSLAQADPATPKSTAALGVLGGVVGLVGAFFFWTWVLASEA